MGHVRLPPRPGALSGEDLVRFGAPERSRAGQRSGWAGVRRRLDLSGPTAEPAKRSLCTSGGGGRAGRWAGRWPLIGRGAGRPRVASERRPRALAWLKRLGANQIWLAIESNREFALLGQTRLGNEKTSERASERTNKASRPSRLGRSNETDKGDLICLSTRDRLRWAPLKTGDASDASGGLLAALPAARPHPDRHRPAAAAAAPRQAGAAAK